MKFLSDDGTNKKQEADSKQEESLFEDRQLVREFKGAIQDVAKKAVKKDDFQVYGDAIVNFSEINEQEDIYSTKKSEKED